MNSASPGFVRRCTLRLAPITLSVLLLIPCSAAKAHQIARDSIPSTPYFTAFGDFFNGDYKQAGDIFNREAKSGIRTAESRWIDSICYYTIAGECYYQMGDFDRALEQYDAALRLANSYSTWMLSVQFPPKIRSAGPAGRIAVPWGRSTRRADIGVYPETMSMGQGRIDNSAVAKTGGPVQAPLLFPVHVTEIVRCTCLAIRRRGEILGPICKHDPLTGQVLAKLSRPSAQAHHWSSAWIDVQLGLAFRAAGETARAATALDRSLLVDGNFDHPLTGVALLELGKIALESGDFNKAAAFFEEATYSAASFSDGIVLEEAFRCGQMTHIVSAQKGIYPPLSSAMAWAKSKNFRQLHASLALLSCENLAIQGDGRTAATMLADAKSTIRGGDMSRGWIGAKFNQLTAMLAYDSGKVSAGDQAIGAALDYQKHGSVWLYQIHFADKLIGSKGSFLTPRLGLTLYDDLLRDPAPIDWARQPLDSLAVLAVPHSNVYEHWFELAMAQGNREMALEISDRVRRHRFYSTLPMGGRLLALRWLMEAPEDRLSNEAKLQRQDLLVRYPKYQELAGVARRLRDGLGPPTDNAEQRKAQAGQLAKISDVAQQQEVILRSIAVRREPSELLFPPLRSTKEVQQNLPKGHVLMSFLATERNLYGFVYSRDRYDTWQISGSATLKKQVIALLRNLGNYEQNHEVTGADLAKAEWKKDAARVLDTMLKKSKVDFSQTFDELIVVPDDFLWYLPFELLPAGRGDATKPMLMQMHVRYAPTVGLALPNGSHAAEKPIVGVTVGKLHPRDDDSVARTAFEHFAQAVPGTIALSNPPPAPSSVYRLQFDTLVVLDDIKPNEAGPYEWSPAQLDRGKPGSQLAAWLSLPWGGPRCVVLPGFHTHAENALKRNSAASGSELFLATCGLMASGTETILISRWRTGGRISFDLAREFVQELPSVPPVDAWQRAVQVVAESTIDSDLEPRVKAIKGDSPKGDFPFFWAGYMLIDSGTKIDADEPRPGQEDKLPKAQPAAKLPAAAAAAGKAEQVGDADDESLQVDAPAEKPTSTPPSDAKPAKNKLPANGKKALAK